MAPGVLFMECSTLVARTPVPLVSQGHMASSEAPCDPPEVSRAFQSEAMANDPSRKYECKP